MSTSDPATQQRHADVLVVHASKGGGTAGIATLIADELRARGLRVDVTTAADAADGVSLAGYRAVVLGSALYARHWRRDAVRFLRRQAATLSSRRVWLFQSGPCGPDAARQAEQGMPEPARVKRLRERIQAGPPITFGGVLDPAAARGVGRWMARGELGGDYRDPERIRTWARTIAESLRSVEQADR
ncbi:flavodoxin domain-containing protein [Pseudonocardia sp. RS11V-5]|uniref:flavodoxin domain-containing protein n=1 Tax=Pseudonocardia terrae TaxID=2905831 RepID=UPI001E569EBF|nr:flavodoxin domain-containing protein [Pseudonocardia terrae]MCE3553146.1 flavodoxin domain-containing protein [Pseudonocardia terrae]